MKEKVRATITVEYVYDSDDLGGPLLKREEVKYLRKGVSDLVDGARKVKVTVEKL